MSFANYTEFHKQLQLLLPNSPDIMLAFLKLDLLNSDEIYKIADTLLNEGKYSDTINDLWASKDLQTQQNLLEKHAIESGAKLLNVEEARKELLKFLLSNITYGHLPPWETMRFIINDVVDNNSLHKNTKKYLGDSMGIEHLIGAFYSTDDYDTDGENPIRIKQIKTKVDSNLIDQAREWLKKYA